LVTSIPSIETYNNIINKKYYVTKLEKRYKEAALPNVEIINLKNEFLKKESWIANKTIDRVNEFLDKGDQVKIVIRFKGRERYIYKEQGMELFERLSKSLETDFLSEPKFVGSSIVAILK